MSVAAFRSHVGFVRETVYGSTSALGSRYLPVLSFDPGWQDDLERIVDEGVRGAPSKDFAVYTGRSMSRGGYTHYFYPDVAGIFLRGIFGGETVSSTSAPYIHTFGSTDIPASYTVYDFHGPAGNSERKVTGAQLERVELNFSRSNGALTIRNSWLGYPSTGIAETTDSYSTESPFRGWQAATTIGATTNARLLDLSLVLARPVELVHAGNNSQAPNAREIGPLEVTGSLTMYGSTFDEFTRYVGNSTGDIDITLTDSTNSLRIVMTDARFTNVTLDRGGVYAKWSAEFRGLHNTTDSGPARMVLTVASSCEF